MRVSYNWLKDYVNIRTSPKDLAEQLTMAGLEVTAKTLLGQDAIMEIEVTPNRPDCLSIIGVAREVAAITGKKLRLPKVSSFRGTSSARIPIQIADKRHCLRYVGRVIRNVKVGPSPEWLIQRLEAMGVRPVNNIVDITNFCLLEFGQPLHAFDLDKLQGQRIIVRMARQGEQITTIDGVRRQLEPKMLVIADRVSPQAIAGIMGAKMSEVGATTTNILLESAYFAPANIQSTSRKLGLATQSSYRFERGVDLEAVALASLRATELIKKLARPVRKKFSNGARPEDKKSKGVIIAKALDKGRKTAPPSKVRLRYAQAREVLGAEISPAQIKEILRALSLRIVRKSKDSLTVSVPSFRPDLNREADLIEEVVRLYGYDKIPLNISALTPELSYAGTRMLPSEQVYDSLRQILSSLGLNEIITYSLISRQALRKLELPVENTIAVRNPLSYEQEILRPTLLAGMLNSLLTNINRKNTSLKLFELSRIYARQDPGAVKELEHLCIGLSGKRSQNWLAKTGEYSFFDLKGIVEVLLNKLGVDNFRFVEGESSGFIPGRSANIVAAEDNYGFLGELKPEILERFDIASAVFVCILKAYKFTKGAGEVKKFRPLARFPAIERDISLIAPQQIRSDEVVSLIKKIGREQITKVTLFDQYFGEQIPQGLRGLSYTIEYRSFNRTLTAQEVDKTHAQVRQALSEELKVQLR